MNEVLSEKGTINAMMRVGGSYKRIQRRTLFNRAIEYFPRQIETAVNKSFGVAIGRIFIAKQEDEESFNYFPSMFHFNPSRFNP